MKSVVLIFTATTTALMAGLFFAWSCSVTIGLARLPDAGYLSAMQSMNRAIQNPLFFCCFFGTSILLPICTFMYYGSPVPACFWLLFAASTLYIIGVLGVTIFGNVPLNNILEGFQIPSASVAEMASLRTRFEGPWNQLNNIRTIAATIAILLVIIACLDPEAT